ncbi:MAG: hypothetical protein BM556_02975 [Bacteriovorax sp. MedPE-SWde]|nr:MAG: hypothetical protein BM556_02975 [Bacteriovorax sp. MedPE-SWde]
MNDDENGNSDDGSIWTSYSDMFTTMAIIFLVMFVFALLRSGVSTLTAIKEKKEKEAFIEGQISDKEKVKDQKIIKNLEKEITQMQSYSQIIDDKMKEMNNFAKKMNKHKDLVAKAMKSQQRTQVALQKTTKKLQSKQKLSSRQKRELKQLNYHIDKYQKDLSKLKISKNSLIKNKTKLEKNLKNREKEITSLKMVNNNEKVRNKKLERSFIQKSKENMIQSQNISSLQRENQRIKDDLKISTNYIQKTEETLKEADTNLRTSMANNIKSQNEIQQKDRTLSRKTQEIAKLSKSIENKNNKIKSTLSELAKIQKYSKSLSNSINNRDSSISKLKTSIASLQGSLAKSKSNQKEQQSRYEKLSKNLQNLKNYTSTLAAKVGDLEDENRSLHKELKSSYAALSKAKGQNKRISRGIASVRNNIRSQIGQNIAQKLKEANLYAKVDPSSGSVTLQMDDAFLFKRNDFHLSLRAKKTLKEIIPLYVDALFKDSSTYNYIEFVNIVGHASPRYDKKYMSPISKNNQDAFNYNMELSTNRAKEIVKYIFSKEFGKFKNKNIFRQKVSAIGRSFSDPIKRSPASTNKDTSCGQYDCKSSRRVEIKFTLKEDKKIWNKLENLN